MPVKSARHHIADRMLTWVRKVRRHTSLLTLLHPNPPLLRPDDTCYQARTHARHTLCLGTNEKSKGPLRWLLMGETHNWIPWKTTIFIQSN